MFVVSTMALEIMTAYQILFAILGTVFLFFQARDDVKTGEVDSRPNWLLAGLAIGAFLFALSFSVLIDVSALFVGLLSIGLLLIFIGLARFQKVGASDAEAIAWITLGIGSLFGLQSIATFLIVNGIGVLMIRFMKGQSKIPMYPAFFAAFLVTIGIQVIGLLQLF